MQVTGSVLVVQDAVSGSKVGREELVSGYGEGEKKVKDKKTKKKNSIER